MTRLSLTTLITSYPENGENISIESDPISRDHCHILSYAYLDLVMPNLTSYRVADLDFLQDTRFLLSTSVGFMDKAPVIRELTFRLVAATEVVPGAAVEANNNRQCD